MTTTKLTKAASNRQSLRTTVPEEVVKQLELKEGDQVEWIVQRNLKYGGFNQYWFIFRKAKLA